MVSDFRVGVARTTPEEIRVTVFGSIDMDTADELFSAIVIAGMHDGEGRVVVDLGQVTFLDSSGLSALVRGQRKLADEGKRLCIANLSHEAQLVVSLTGVDTLIPIEGASSSVPQQ